jgi:hypothetical protein
MYPWANAFKRGQGASTRIGLESLAVIQGKAMVGWTDVGQFKKFFKEEPIGLTDWLDLELQVVKVRKEQEWPPVSAFISR